MIAQKERFQVFSQELKHVPTNKVYSIYFVIDTKRLPLPDPDLLELPTPFWDKAEAITHMEYMNREFSNSEIG